MHSKSWLVRFLQRTQCQWIPPLRCLGQALGVGPWTPTTKRRRIECCPTSARKRQRCSRPATHVNVLDDCEAFQLHCRNNNDQHCDKCVFARNRVKLEQLTRLPDSEKSWLMPRPLENKDWYLICGPCEVAAKMNTDTPAAAWRAARLPRFRGRITNQRCTNKLARSAATRSWTHRRSRSLNRHGRLPRAHQARRELR